MTTNTASNSGVSNWKLPLLLSIMLFIVTAIVQSLNSPISTLISGKLAANQMDASDTGYIVASQASWFAGSGALISFLSFVVFGIIWFPFLRSLNKHACGCCGVLVLGLVFMTPKAHAYYDAHDNEENYTIGPNQSAYLIPLVGDNLTSQKSLNSMDYLDHNKVATKRINIPHVLTHNSMMTVNMYVPSAQLILVDRTPYQREWTDESDRGTSSKKEGLHFESKDSLNIGANITVAASVKPENGTLFLFNFGVDPIAGDPNAPETQYASVIRGKSLDEVMDGIVHGKVQAVMAREFAKYNLEEALGKKVEIIDAVQKEVTEFFATKGITIEYIGYASALNEDPEIQKAINSVFIATYKAKEQTALANVLAVRSGYANVMIKESIAQNLGKWNGQVPAMPSFAMLSNGFFNWFDRLVGVDDTSTTLPIINTPSTK